MDVEATLRQVNRRYKAAADPVRAEGAAKYLLNQFPHYGLYSAPRRQIDRELTRDPANVPQTIPDAKALIEACWDAPHRELQYFGMETSTRFVKRGLASPAYTKVAKFMITNKSWWDTVDHIADKTVGGLVLTHPQLVTTLDEWIKHDNIWLARAAIIHQLSYKHNTDEQRLFRYCLTRADDHEFFIRKAIGWALRQYARVEPQHVADFTHKYEARFSALTLREARKHLTHL